MLDRLKKIIYSRSFSNEFLIGVGVIYLISNALGILGLASLSGLHPTEIILISFFATLSRHV